MEKYQFAKHGLGGGGSAIRDSILDPPPKQTNNNKKNKKRKERKQKNQIIEGKQNLSKRKEQSKETARVQIQFPALLAGLQ